jgi:putative acetyltransferase
MEPEAEDSETGGWAIRAATSDDVEFVRQLLIEYQRELGIDLCFQDFDEELAEPLETYEVILLAAAGCVALRRLDEETCEMKRLFLRPSARRAGLGRGLAEAVIEEARARGFARMVLDTFSSMTEATHLYRSLGFRETAAYRFNPYPEALYFELDLGRPFPSSDG